MGIVVEGGVVGLVAVVRGVVGVLFARVRRLRSRKAGATYWRVVGMVSVWSVRGRGGWMKAKKRVVLSRSCVVLIVHAVSGSFAGLDD